MNRKILEKYSIAGKEKELQHVIDDFMQQYDVPAYIYSLQSNKEADEFICVCKNVSFEYLKMNLDLAGISTPDNIPEFVFWLEKQKTLLISNTLSLVLLMSMFKDDLSRNIVRLFRKANRRLLIAFFMQFRCIKNV